MRVCAFAVIAGFVCLSPAPAASPQDRTAATTPEPSPGVTITYLYDNTAAAPGVTADWGFACLVDGHGARVLFDTGAKPGILAHNAQILGVDLGRLDAVVLSHDHGDHTAGLPALGARPGLRLFYARGFSPEVVARLGSSGAVLVPVLKSTEVVPGIRTSDEFGTAIKEEALLIDTPDGLVVVVGCSHPGIVPMLQQVRATAGRPIHAVIGGFHLLQTPAADVTRMVAAFKELGVVRVGPTHCTGPDAIRQYREAYGSAFIEGGVGRVVTVAQRPSAGHGYQSFASLR
jgi:7,8-dihydropterin-6-yl-methyl-4-(beta-D-ribofuranosyl)aminobenzene 5'-phosphate synthase